MKKRIYPCGVGKMFSGLGLISIFALFLYVLYIGFTDSQFRYSIPFMLIFSTYVLYYIVILYSEKIIIHKGKIIIRGDKTQRKNGFDYEIAFDDIGTKKLMAKTASAHMKKL